VTPIKVVIGDRSPSVRAVLKRLIAQSPSLEVVGEAADAGQLVDTVRCHGPDVIVTEFLHPDLDRTAPVEQATLRRPTPVVVLTSRPEAASGHTPYWGSSNGVVEVLQKPRVPEAWSDLAPTLRSLLQKVGVPTSGPAREGLPVIDPPIRGKLEYVAIGGSTGGPGSVVRLLREFGTGFSAGVAVVQHIADGFEHSFADWLRLELGADVRVAESGESLDPGVIRVAPVGSHLLIDRDGTLRLDGEKAPRRGHRPSADLLFRSFLSVGADRVAAVVLSGMGDDGVDGMRALRDAGSLTLAQDEASSAVYGMPKVAIESGAAELALTPTEIGRMLSRLMTGEAE
jgi:two-component system chemotaxis response regulator CheB